MLASLAPLLQLVLAWKFCFLPISWSAGAVVPPCWAGSFWQSPQKEPKGLAPPSGPALRSGFVTRFARPSGQPTAVTPLRYVALHRRSEGRLTRAIRGPLSLSPHPCGSPLYASTPLTL